ncbi:MAG: hypothetical protein ACO1OX_08225 [Novosphingobium sp.]
MDSDDLAWIIGVGMSLALVVASLKGRQMGLSDGLRMATLWGFLIVALTLVFTTLRW